MLYYVQRCTFLGTFNLIKQQLSCSRFSVYDYYSAHWVSLILYTPFMSMM